MYSHAGAWEQFNIRSFQKVFPVHTGKPWNRQIQDEFEVLCAWMRLQNRSGQHAPKGVSGYAFRRERVSGARATEAAGISKTNQRTKYSTAASIFRGKIKYQQLRHGMTF
ncbi:hypothetical protein [Vibrio quintilis]|uniref:hypothetical protein n=1 Tax=Vibrio quintilis TaxID=1117707 RepID=UPI0011612A5E|nr:hypothetical protein [Vibrio quintilis]